MKIEYAEIEKRFTEEVAGFLANGWTFSTRTMGGSQGEIAKCDLTDGKNLARVLLERKRFFGHEEVLLSVGTFVPKGDGTAWNSDLDTVRSFDYYGVDGEWFDSMEDARKRNPAPFRI